MAKFYDPDISNFRWRTLRYETCLQGGPTDRRPAKDLGEEAQHGGHDRGPARQGKTRKVSLFQPLILPGRS